MEKFQLWQRTLGDSSDSFKEQREVLRQSFLSFRSRVKDLVSTISSELPGLTVHDITHIDALWRVANEIAGPNYPINPAEAYVLGGAFLLHDAAHVIAAYPGGLAEIKNSQHWRDLVAQRYSNKDPDIGSPEEKEAIFFVLRLLHAEQAHALANMKWKIPDGEEDIYLIEDMQLRSFYGDVIGDIAASHHWSPHEVVDSFRERFLPPPAFLQPATWTVDTLKIAFLLRTADAAHIDSARAPWFLFALKQPSGISKEHWRFQAKLAQPIRNENGELLICSPSPFKISERSSWWLAFDTARMINSELVSADLLMQEENREAFSAKKVAHLESTEAFAKAVRTSGWEPLDFGPTVGDIPNLIKTLGGTALYGEKPSVAIRELIQNAIDAIGAFRHLNELGCDYGEILVRLTSKGPGSWELCVQDNGIGMSRFVLTRVLLDFGNSLWRSDKVREELPGLASSGFASGGQFGIGFYSVFMVTNVVSVTTRRYERAASDDHEQWKISFEKGLDGRPLLSQPESKEKLIQCGTNVLLMLTTEKLIEILSGSLSSHAVSRIFESPESIGAEHLERLVKAICPAADVKINIDFNGLKKTIINASDWKDESSEEINGRVLVNSAAKGDLYPLRMNDGVLAGRLGLVQSYFDSACVTLNGVKCGELPNVVGIITTNENNKDAKRSQAQLPSGIDWRGWVETVLKEESKISRKNLLLLHPLVSDKDLRVWEFDGTFTTLKRIEEYIASSSEILTHAGDISHDDTDDMSSSRFDFFEPVSKLICVPSLPSYYKFEARLQFPWCAGVEKINYKEILESRLKSIWGGFVEEEDDDALVGDASGQEVFRTVTRYYRSAD